MDRNGMDRKYNKELIPNARALRRSMTKEERHLWYDFLKTYPVKFVRQKVIGQYIVDFYCPAKKIVIELDGSQHYEDAEIAYDKQRTAYLSKFGINVIRIPNNEVTGSFNSVCEYIDRIIQEDSGSLSCSGGNKNST